MPNRKTVQLFLLDGTPTGPIKCTLSNWTGRVYLIPRTQLKELAQERPDLNHNGVYLLFGTSDQDDRTTVYVGQARSRLNGNGTAGRIIEHDNDRLDYYTHAVIITTSEDYFGPTEISYLEHKFYCLAVESGRYLVANGNSPSRGNVTEEKQAELDEFIEFTTIAVGSLGYKVFEPIDDAKNIDKKDSSSESKANPVSNNNILSFSGSDFSAKGRQTSDGFVVLSGSRIRKDQTISCPPSREQKVKSHQDALDNFITTKDILFSSPTTAAVFVSGRSSNGLTSWKNSKMLLSKS